MKYYQTKTYVIKGTYYNINPIYIRLYTYVFDRNNTNNKNTNNRRNDATYTHSCDDNTDKN